MNVREYTTSSELHPDVRNLMIKFWDACDKLYHDMDFLSEEEFFEREHEMWSYRDQASEINGDYFLISLWGMSEKAEKLYGKGTTNRFIEFLNKKDN